MHVGQQSWAEEHCRSGAGPSEPHPLNGMGSISVVGASPMDVGADEDGVQGTEKGSDVHSSGPSDDDEKAPAGTMGSWGWLSAWVQSLMGFSVSMGMP